MKPHIQGDWWNDVAIKTSVLLADFNKQMESRRMAGMNVSKFVYHADERIKLMRKYGHANV